MSEQSKEILESLHDNLCELSKQLVFDKSQVLHFHVISLYGSMLEYSSSMVCLAADGCRASIPIVFRSLLDAALDLLNLCKNPSYGHRLEMDYAKGWKKLLGAAIRGENIYLKALGELPEVRKSFQHYKKIENDLKSKGFKRVDMEEKFSLLDMQDEYVAIYPFLNDHVHNNLSALQRRHISHEGDVFQITFYKDYPLEDFIQYYGMACELLMRCTEQLHEKFSSSAIDQIKELRKNIDGQLQSLGKA